MHIGRMIKLPKEVDGPKICPLGDGPAPSRVVGATPENVRQYRHNLGTWTESIEEAPKERRCLANATGRPRHTGRGGMQPKRRVHDDVSRFPKPNDAREPTPGPYPWKLG